MALYAGVFEGMALAFTAIFGWTLGEGRTRHPVPAEARRSAWWRFSIGALIYNVSTAAWDSVGSVSLTHNATNAWSEFGTVSGAAAEGAAPQVSPKLRQPAETARLRQMS